MSIVTEVQEFVLKKSIRMIINKEMVLYLHDILHVDGCLCNINILISQICYLW